MEQTLLDFENYLKQNQKDEKTIYAYTKDVEQFLDYFKNIDLKEISLEDIEEYKIFMIKEIKLEIKTVNRKLISISLFLKFCNIAVIVKQEKTQMQNFLNDILNDSDIDRILRAIDKKNDIRAKAIITTLRMTGMRVSEMLQLTKYDINKDTVMICGKGKKYREVFIPDKLKKILNEYIKVRIDNCDALFTGKRGAIVRQTVDKIIKYYGGQARVKMSKNHAHNFRHYSAKTYADKKIDINIIADILGHSSLNVTALYLRKTKKELLDIINDI